MHVLGFHNCLVRINNCTICDVAAIYVTDLQIENLYVF